MSIEYTKNLRAWVEEEEDFIWRDDVFVECTIKALSDYIAAVDSEYVYNKTFLNSFIDDFLESRKKLKEKKHYFESLIKELDDYSKDISLDVDGAWIYNAGEIRLSNSLNSSLINSDKIRFQVRYNNKKKTSFVIARETCIDNAEEEIERIAELFNSRITDDEH